MPSGTLSIGDILKHFESLLAASTGLSSRGSGIPGGGLSKIVGSLGSDEKSRGLPESLTEGLFGGTLGLVAGLFGSLFRTKEEPSTSFSPLEKPDSLFLQYDVAATPSDLQAVTLGPAGTGLGEPLSATRGSTLEQPSVVIHVNAMDAQSFSSRSDDIASAVREALTRNHALRDEIWED